MSTPSRVPTAESVTLSCNRQTNFAKGRSPDPATTHTPQSTDRPRDRCTCGSETTLKPRDCETGTRPQRVCTYPYPVLRPSAGGAASGSYSWTGELEISPSFPGSANAQVHLAGFNTWNSRPLERWRHRGRRGRLSTIRLLRGPLKYVHQLFGAPNGLCGGLSHCSRGEAGGLRLQGRSCRRDAAPPLSRVLQSDRQLLGLLFTIRWPFRADAP